MAWSRCAWSRQRDERGETLFAIYHSHVASPARPSQTDVRMAFFPPGETDSEPAYPGTIHLLVSLAEEPPPLHAYYIHQRRRDRGDPGGDRLIAPGRPR